MRRPMPVDFKVSQILPLLKFNFAVVFQRRFPDSAKHQCYIFFKIYFLRKQFYTYREAPSTIFDGVLNGPLYF